MGLFFDRNTLPLRRRKKKKETLVQGTIFLPSLVTLQTTTHTHPQDDECLLHPAMKEKELRKAFKLDTKKPPTGRMLLLQCLTALRMHNTRQSGITRGQLFIIQMRKWRLTEVNGLLY